MRIAHVLSSLEIKNFRTFSHLFIERLGRVNLILGKNNVGKTTLLEALRLYGSIWPRSTVASILHERNEVARSTEGRTLLLLQSLFHGRQVEQGDEIIIRQSRGGGGRPGFHAAAHFETEWREGSLREGNLGHASAATLALDVKWPGRDFTLYPDGAAAYAIASASPKPPDFSPDPPSLGGSGVPHQAEDTIAHWWDELSLTEAEQRVLNAMQLIMPIQGVRFVGDPRKDGGRLAKTRVEGMSEPVALATVGGGAVRMFQIAVAMEYAALRSRAIIDADPTLENAFPMLLIDEVETGIHHTLHADLWRFIFGAARLLDVQVFATTHSWDCLRSFAEAVAEDDKADGLVVRLERDKDEVATRAIVIDRTKLPIIVRDAIEVR